MPTLLPSNTSIEADGGYAVVELYSTKLVPIGAGGKMTPEWGYGYRYKDEEAAKAELLSTLVQFKNYDTKTKTFK